MPFAWVLNQDAELELARPGYNPSAKLLTQLKRHGAAAGALLGTNDVLIEPGAKVNENFIGRAWCPTPLALAKLRAAGARPEPHPATDVLRRVNHRRFAFDLGGGLPRQHYVTTREQIEMLLAQPVRWVCKRPLAFAGRGQLRVSNQLDAKQSSWVDASIRHDGLVVEPLVKPSVEVSVHGFLWPDNRLEFGRVCLQHVSGQGVFLGVSLAGTHLLQKQEHLSLYTQAHRVAKALAIAGYFGPFGIDAYRYESHDGVGFCALGEINARYTMGFATGFPRHPSQITF